MGVRSKGRNAELAGEPPQLAAVGNVFDEPKVGHIYPGQLHRVTDNKSKRGPVLHLKSVIEALQDEGLDPATEIARILRGRPVFDDKGQPVVDPMTGDQLFEHEVDADTRLRTMNSLLEFTQPRLKAVEMKVSGSLELSGDQLDQRIAMLMAKAEAS